MRAVPGEGARRPAALDRSIAFLASQAAVELDRRARGIDASLDAANRLGEALQDKVPHQGGATPPSRALLDPLTAHLFGRVFGPTHGQGRQSAKELKEKTQSFATRLTSLDPATEETELRDLRDLCVALAERAQGELEHYREARPRSPFHR